MVCAFPSFHVYISHCQFEHDKKVGTLKLVEAVVGHQVGRVPRHSAYNDATKCHNLGGGYNQKTTLGLS